MGQIHIHVDRGHRMLTLPCLIQNGYRIGDGLDPDLFDIDAPVVKFVLDIFHKPEAKRLSVVSYVRDSRQDLVLSD